MLDVKKTCTQCHQTKSTDEFGKRAAMRDGHLSWCRPCESKRKKRLRLRAAERPVEPKDSIYRVWIPTIRLQPALNAWCERNHISMQSDGIIRRVFAIQSGEQQHVRFDTVDRLLIVLGLEYLWHQPVAEGGLADIYEGEPKSALASRSGLGGLSTGCASPRGGTSEGTNLTEREAA